MSTHVRNIRVSLSWASKNPLLKVTTGSRCRGSKRLVQVHVFRLLGEHVCESMFLGGVSFRWSPLYCKSVFDKHDTHTHTITHTHTQTRRVTHRHTPTESCGAPYLHASRSKTVDVLAGSNPTLKSWQMRCWPCQHSAARSPRTRIRNSIPDKANWEPSTTPASATTVEAQAP